MSIFKHFSISICLMTHPNPPNQKTHNCWWPLWPLSLLPLLFYSNWKNSKKSKNQLVLFLFCCYFYLFLQDFFNSSWYFSLHSAFFFSLCSFSLLYFLTEQVLRTIGHQSESFPQAVIEQIWPFNMDL